MSNLFNKNLVLRPSKKYSRPWESKMIRQSSQEDGIDFQLFVQCEKSLDIIIHVPMTRKMLEQTKNQQLLRSI